MSIAPPPANSSASSTTDTAPTYTTSKVLEGHQPNIPGIVVDKYNEGLEDPSKRPKENIHAQEDFIASLPRKDVSFGAQAALDRDRVPLVKRTEVHAVPAETSQENLLQDKHIEVSDVQIPPTRSQSSNKQEDSQSMPSESMLSEQESSSLSSTHPDADTKQDAMEASTSSFKEELPKQDQQLEESATQHQQNLIAEKKEHEDTRETEAPEFKENVEKHNQQVDESSNFDKENVNPQKEQNVQTLTDIAKDKLSSAKETLKEAAKDKLSSEKQLGQDVPTPPTKESQAELSTAKKWEEQHVQPFDIPRTPEQASETREKPAETSKSSDSVLPTDQYNLKSDSNKQESTITDTLKSSERVIEAKLAGLVHTITHDLPAAARELLNEFEASKSQSQTEKSSSGGLLPTDQYDLKPSEIQKEPTEISKSTNEKVLEEKHVEPFDDHTTEPKQHHFIQDKIAGLVHTVTHDLPIRAKELLSKPEENKSQPPSPTQAPPVQEREEKQTTEQQSGDSSSVIKQREFDPEEMLFF